MRAKPAPPSSQRRSAAPIVGASARAGGSRSLRVARASCAGVASRVRAAAAAAARCRAGQAPKTPRPSTTPTPGLTSTSGRARKTRSIGEIVRRSRARSAAGGKAHRHVGAERSADRGQLVGVDVQPPEPASARSVAAASLEPPPMPEATGRFFSSAMATGGQCRLAGNAAAAHRVRLSTRLLPSSGTVGAKARSTTKPSCSAGARRHAGRRTGEDRQALDQVIAVGAPAGDMQREVDLGRRAVRSIAAASGVQRRSREWISPWRAGTRRSWGP